MELKFYFYVAYFFIALFVFYFFRTLNWSILKLHWYEAIKKVETQKEALERAEKEALERAQFEELKKIEIEKAIKKGQKPFDVGRGKNKATVYGTSQIDAMLKHKKSQIITFMSPRRTQPLKKV